MLHKSSKSKQIVVLLLASLCVSGLPTAQAIPQAAKAETNVKLGLGLLIDTGWNQRNVMALEREIANSIASGLQDRAMESFAIGYSDEIEMIQDWFSPGLPPQEIAARADTRSTHELNRSLLNDAVRVGLSKLNSQSTTTKKVLVIIGEGNDSGSTVDYSQVAELAKSSHVQCFAVLVTEHALPGGRVRHFGFDLYRLAYATKGKAYDVGKSARKSSKVIKDVLKRIRS